MSENDAVPSGRLETGFAMTARPRYPIAIGTTTGPVVGCSAGAYGLMLARGDLDFPTSKRPDRRGDGLVADVLFEDGAFADFDFGTGRADCDARRVRLDLEGGHLKLFGTFSNPNALPDKSEPRGDLAYDWIADIRKRAERFGRLIVTSDPEFPLVVAEMEVKARAAFEDRRRLLDEVDRLRRVLEMSGRSS